MAILNIKPLQISSVTASFHWRVDYAAEVHRDRPFVDASIAGISDGLPSAATTAWASSGSTIGVTTEIVDLASGEFRQAIDDHEWQITPRGRKRFRDAPTWRTITDSGRLRDSMDTSIREGL